MKHSSSITSNTLGAFESGLVKLLYPSQNAESTHEKPVITQVTYLSAMALAVINSSIYKNHQEKYFKHWTLFRLLFREMSRKDNLLSADAEYRKVNSVVSA